MKSTDMLIMAPQPTRNIIPIPKIDLDEGGVRNPPDRKVLDELDLVIDPSGVEKAVRERKRVDRDPHEIRKDDANAVIEIEKGERNPLPHDLDVVKKVVLVLVLVLVLVVSISFALVNLNHPEMFSFVECTPYLLPIAFRMILLLV